jgi:hypothetical protein
MTTPGMRPGDPNAKGGNEEILPDYCLVRILDVTIQPGKTYEYRMRIRMANPNYGRKDVASPAYARDPELKSDWSKQTVTIRIDSELDYYAIDQRPLDEAEEGFKRPYRGPYANNHVRDSSGNFVTITSDPNVIVLQAQRWLETLPIGSPPIGAGEWVVAERFPVFRGEYVGHSERVQVPYWRYLRNDWVIADDRANKRVPGVRIQFGYNGESNQPEAILVDFHRGSTGYSRVVSRNEDQVKTEKVSDSSAGEVLILNPDGKLILRETASDVKDERRIKILKEVRSFIETVKDPSKGTPDNKGGSGFTNE